MTKKNKWSAKQNNGKHAVDTNIWDLYDNIKCANLHLIGLPKGKDIKAGIKNVLGEIMAENFPNVKKEIDIRVQETQRIQNDMNPNRSAARQIIIKMAKVKERILKAAREK